MKRCWMFGRPDRVMPDASTPVSALSAPVSTAMLAAPIVNCQHVTAFAVIELVPIQSAVMFWPLARVVETLEYQMETVTPAAAVPWPFVNPRACVQRWAAVSWMDKRSPVFRWVVGLVPIARVMEFVAVVTRAPLASCTCTWIAGEIATVGAALEGWTLKASCAGGPAAAALKSAPDWLTVADPLSVHAWVTVAAPLPVDPP